MEAHSKCHLCDDLPDADVSITRGLGGWDMSVYLMGSSHGQSEVGMSLDVFDIKFCPWCGTRLVEKQMKSEVLEYKDEDGYSCRLERWYSDYERKWKVAATCYRPDGSQMFHAGAVWAEFSEDGAREQLDLVRNLARGFKELCADDRLQAPGERP